MTIPQIINIANVSLYLASEDVAANGILSRGMIDALIAKKIYSEKISLEWMYGVDPSETSLLGVSNFVYELCGNYGIQAKNILGY